MRDLQWLKDRIQSRVHRLLAVVNTKSIEHFSELQVGLLMHVLRRLSESLVLIGYVLFVTTFNLVTRVGLLQFWEHLKMLVWKSNVFQNSVNALSKMVLKNLIFCPKAQNFV